MKVWIIVVYNQGLTLNTSEEDLSTDLSTHLLAAIIGGTRMILGVQFCEGVTQQQNIIELI